MLFAERCPSLICGCKGTKNNCKLKKNAVIFVRYLFFCFFSNVKSQRRKVFSLCLRGLAFIITLY